MYCKNCNTEIIENSDYCHSCGGKVIRNRLTFRNLFEHISETFFNYDNKLLRTFINLFTKPEDVIVGYINGTRKKYVNVISYFALALTLAGLQVYVIQKFQTDMTFYDTSTEVGKTQQEIFSKFFNFSTDYQSLMMMLYIPFYAIMARLVFIKDRTFNLTELIVFFLYTQAQLSICIALLTITLVPLNIVSFTTLGFFVFPIMLLYYAYCFKRIYELTTMEIILRTLIFLIVFGFIMVIIMIGAGIIMYKSGMFDQMIEAKKAAIDSTKSG